MYYSRILLINLITVSTILSSSFAQNIQDKTSKDLIGGVWEVCVSIDFNTDYQCNNGFTSYEFFGDGSYNENNISIINGDTIPFQTGVWTFNSNKLMVDQNDTKYHIKYPIDRDIIWQDKDRFYTIGQEGLNGPTVYTFFKRIK